MLLTWRKTVSSSVGVETIIEYEYDDLGESLEGVEMPTVDEAPVVKIDCDENRYVYVDDIDTDGFAVKGGNIGDDAPYNLRIAIEIPE